MRLYISFFKYSNICIFERICCDVYARRRCFVSVDAFPCIRTLMSVSFSVSAILTDHILYPVALQACVSAMEVFFIILLEKSSIILNVT